MQKLRYNHNKGEYVAPLDDQRVLIVDADRFNYCLRNDDKLDEPLYQIDTWLPYVDDDEVRIERRSNHAIE